MGSVCAETTVAEHRGEGNKEEELAYEGTKTTASSSGAMRAETPGAHLAKTSWYVVQSKRHREELAQAFLGQRDIRTYLPRILQWPRPAVGSEIGPMFPGYLFAQLALPGDFYRTVWTPGVKNLVSFGGEPTPVPAGAVEFLQSREGPDGLIRCGGTSTRKQQVQIVRGPFKGLYGLVEKRLTSKQRVLILMELLQRETRVEVPETWLRQAR